MTSEDLNFFLMTTVTYSTVVPVGVALRDPYSNCVSFMPNLPKFSKQRAVLLEHVSVAHNQAHNQTVISVQFSPDTMLIERVSVVHKQASQPNSYQTHFSPDISIIISNSMCTVLTRFYEECFLGR